MKKTGALAFAACVASGVAAADTLAQPQTTALEKAAAHYIQYREDVVAIENTPMDNAAATRMAHKHLSAHDPAKLASGWVAYAALVAADTPEFAAALQQEVNAKKRGRNRKKLVGKDAFFAKLAQDPTYPSTIPGADAAIDRVLAMTAQDAERFTSLGESFKEQAYAMQKTNWGKKRIASSKDRLSEAKKFSASRPTAAAPSMQPETEKGVTAPMLASIDETWAHDWGMSSSATRTNDPNANAVMQRVLNLAARYAVSGVNEKLVSVYSKNAKSKNCMDLAKLTLDQCIAATRTPYEEAFCLGEHGLNDIGTCVGWVAGAGSS
ncbi:MAG: hypothetical protein AAGJ87_07615 [Pseudomonadota bacterium]